MSAVVIRSAIGRGAGSCALMAAYILLITLPGSVGRLLDLYFDRNGPATGTGAGFGKMWFLQIVFATFFISALIGVPCIWRAENKKYLSRQASFWRRLFYSGMGLSFGYWYRGGQDTALFWIALLCIFTGLIAMIEEYFKNRETN